VTEQFHDMKNVFGFGVLGGGLPMSKRVEGYRFQPWVLERMSHPQTVFSKDSSKAS
jgi:hypothetical protein